MNRLDTSTIHTGLTKEEHSFVWKIDNIPLILKHDSMINAQVVEFTFGGGIGPQSKWSVYLEVKPRDRHCRKKRICMFYKMMEPILVAPRETLCSQIYALQKNLKGKTVWSEETDMEDISNNVPPVNGFRFLEFDGSEEAVEKSWEFHVTLKLYSTKSGSPSPPPPPSTSQQPVQEKLLEEFQLNSTAKARRDLAGLVQYLHSITGDLKIISSDQKEFSVPKRILAVRSPTFDEMLRADKGSTGWIDLQDSDMTERTLKVFLHFIYTGELLPEWKEEGVIVELVNAASKYKLSDLLDFMDVILGKICDLQNVTALLTLATRHSLKNAEGELLKFVSEKVANSAQNFFQIMHVTSLMEC